MTWQPVWGVAKRPVSYLESQWSLRGEANERLLHFLFHQAFWHVGESSWLGPLNHAPASSMGDAGRFRKREKDETGRGWRGKEKPGGHRRATRWEPVETARGNWWGRRRGRGVCVKEEVRDPGSHHASPKSVPLPFSPPLTPAAVQRRDQTDEH